MTLYAILAAARSMVTNVYKDIFVDAGICASVSVDQVLSGKHYNRGLRVCQLLLDALKRLKLQEFPANTSSDVSDLCDML